MAWKLDGEPGSEYDDLTYIRDAALSLEPARWSAVAHALDMTMARPNPIFGGTSGRSYSLGSSEVGFE